MTLINHEQIIDGLSQLANESEQRRLWLGEGQEEITEFSSFIEACCELFQDSALDNKLYFQGTEFGSEVDAMLKKIDDLTEAMSIDRPQEKIIADPKMAMVRIAASTALRHIMSMGGKNSTRIVDRVIEWRDEERQRMLWFPDADKLPPRSSPQWADWHLFHGKDYWGYLDLGTEKRELSTLFRDMGSLVFRLKTYVSRPPEAVLADPLMEPIREMAAQIASRLGIE